MRRGKNQREKTFASSSKNISITFLRNLIMIVKFVSLNDAQVLIFINRMYILLQMSSTIKELLIKEEGIRRTGEQY